MPIWHHQDTIRLLPGGAGSNGATVTFKRVSDNSTITTATADANGFFQKSLAATATSGASSYELHPGPYYTETTSGAYTRYHSSVSIGKAGPLDLAALVQLNRAIGTGLLSDPANSLAQGAVTSAGVARTVVVDTFAAVIQGLPVWNDAARTITISANASGNPRIDTIVIEMVPAGQATEGKCTLKVVNGTAAASPVAPTLTQTAALWQFPLANVAVANGAAVINQANITDRRDYVERSVTAIEADVILIEDRLDTPPAAVSAIARITDTALFGVVGTGLTGIAALTGTITLVAGVTYDIFMRANVNVAGTSGYFIYLTLNINGVNSVATFTPTLTGTPIQLANAHVRLGLSGSSVPSCVYQVIISQSSASANAVYSAPSHVEVVAIPRGV